MNQIKRKTPAAVFRFFRGKTAILAVTVIAAVLIAGIFTGCGGGQPRSAAARLTLQVTAPAARVTLTDPAVTVTGIVSDAAAKVTVRDVPVTVGADGAFSHTIDLAYGGNTIPVRATIEGQNPVTRTLNITRNLVLDVTSPQDKSTVAEKAVTVSGKVSDPAAKVLINGAEVALEDDGTFSSLVDLFYITTTLNVSTMLEGVAPITKLITVTRQ